jgi:hypothetical protein
MGQTIFILYTGIHSNGVLSSDRHGSSLMAPGHCYDGTRGTGVLSFSIFSYASASFMSSKSLPGILDFWGGLSCLLLRDLVRA